jgi:arginine decarboxylase
MDRQQEPFSGIYGIEKWGRGMFEVLAGGDIGLIDPTRPEAEPVNLPSVLHQLEERGICAPVLLRVGSFLSSQIHNLNTSFARAIADIGYRGAYRGVFPVKVNQQAQVIEQIVVTGRAYDFGLEVGSKPELIIALCQKLSPQAMLICNGVKDTEYIQLALWSLKLGFNTVIVLERPRELELVLRQADGLGIEPLLGVRVKLSHRVGGNWAQSSGDRSSFGMKTDEVVTVIDQLKQAGMLHCLKLQHSHLGSQIPDIRDIRHTVNEASRFFTELRGEGAPLTHLDLGGGLGIDYTGEGRADENSVNYTLDEYCANVVEGVSYAMEAAGQAHPILVTESGRAIVAFSSILLFNILDTTKFDSNTAVRPQSGDHHMVGDLAAICDYLNEERLQECLNDANYYRDELRDLFRVGQVALREMGRAENIYLGVIGRIKQVAAEAAPDSLSDDVASALDRHVDIYHGNFSVFQSLPDIWAIDQVHPIVPIQRLDEEPTRRAILSDITCDSDGRIDQFVLADGRANALPVHDLNDEQPYYLGVFFVGAYQETLGDLHNLFGDTNVVTIELRGDGGFDLVHEVEGDTIGQVLSYVEYDPKSCLDAFKAIVEKAVSRGDINNRERRIVTAAYKDSMTGLTYYEN